MCMRLRPDVLADADSTSGNLEADNLGVTHADYVEGVQVTQEVAPALLNLR